MACYKNYFYVFILLTAILLLNGCSQEQAEFPENKEEVIETVPDISSDTEDMNTEDSHYIEMDVQNPFNQNGWWMKIVGLKEYTSLETDFYTDKPQEGNIYLVLFLELRNGTPSQHYIASEDIEASVDNNKIETTFLANEPEGYPTIKNEIASEETKHGFLVWEVPENWKTVQIQYIGWDYSIQCIPTINLTPNDLFDPVAYDEIEIIE